jgi:CheY-like chemotaxis protein
MSLKSSSLPLSSPASTDNDKGSSNLHVMLIDDSMTILQVVSRSLRKKGYQVTTAQNGSAGLDRLIKGYATQEFDFVLMDLQMPVMVNILLLPIISGQNISHVMRYNHLSKCNLI